MTNKNFNNRTQFLARFGYQGDKFYGVQEQKSVPTVLGALRSRVEKNTGYSVKALCVAARTDRGVHAVENYATFFIRNLAVKDVPKIKSAAEASITDGIVGLDLEVVSPHVHARGSSRGKIYRYYLRDLSEHEKNEDDFVWHVVPKLDVERIKAAAQCLVGEMDFSSLRGGGCSAGSTIKNIFYIDTTRLSDGRIVLEIHGDAFLRKMIRNMVGLLVEVGAGLRAAEEIPPIMLAKSREAAGIMAPAHGLFLHKVVFEY